MISNPSRGKHPRQSEKRSVKPNQYDRPECSLYDVESEKAVLGSMAIANGCAPLVRSLLPPEAFAVPEHRTIYTAFENLLDRGTPADMLTLARELERMGELELIGGNEALIGILDSVPHAAHVESYAGEVRSHWVRRCEYERAVERMEKALDPSTPLEEISPTEARFGRGIELVPFSCIPPQPVEWLWPGRIALGKVTLLCGNPGLGKTFMTLDAAQRVANELYWPDGTGPAPKGEVVILSGEDGPADTIRPRLDAIGANVERIFTFKGVRTLDKKGKSFNRQLNLKLDLEHLRTMLQNHPDVRLVIVDPISQYLGDVDSHKNAEVRAVLGPLGELAEEFKVAVLSVTHLSKGVGPAIYRAMGSMAFVAQARAAFAIVKSPDDEELRYFLPIKNNLAPKPEGLAYRILDGRMEWEMEPVSADVDELVSPTPQKKSSSAGKLEEAVKWIRVRLKDSEEVESDTFLEEMEEAGFSKATIKRAKSESGVISRKERVKYGPWMVSLPKQSPESPFRTLETHEPLENLGWSKPDQESQPVQEFQEERGEQDHE